MHSSDARSNSDQNILSAGSSLYKEQLTSQCSSSERGREKYATEQEAQHSTDSFLQSGDNSTEARTVGHKDDKQYPNVPEQRNIGLPVIINALSEDLSTLNVPEVFKQSQRTEGRSNVSGNSSLSIFAADHELGNDDIKAPPLKMNRRSWKGRKLSGESGYNVVLGSPETCQPFEECENSTCPTNTETGDLLEATSMCNNVDDNDDNDDDDDDDDNGDDDDDDDDQFSIQFYSLRNNVIVIMSEKARFSFTGKLVVRTMYGAVKVYGYIITKKAGAVEMYSPRGYGNISVETSEAVSGGSETEIWLSLSAECIFPHEHSQLVADIKKVRPGMAILVLWNLETKLTKFLTTFFPFRLFPRIKAVPYYSSTDWRRAEMILQSKLYIGDNRCFDLIYDPRFMEEITDKMLSRCRENEWSCTLVAGGKNVGKSSMVRFLTNSLLSAGQRVVLLDIDLGQSECTPPGCISYSLISRPLLGPNFTHLNTPDFQLYIGHVNVSRCIGRYIEGIQILVDKIRKCSDLSRLPIVVNTMGFVHGIGWHIALSTIKLIRPSHVVQIMSEKPKNNYIEYLRKHVVNQQRLLWTLPTVDATGGNDTSCDHELIVLRSLSERKNIQGYGTWNMEPYQKRELLMISYFSEISPRRINFAEYYNAAALSVLDAVPYAAPFSSLSISIPQARVPPTHVLNVVNGNIVALGGIDAKDESTEGETVFGLRVLDRLPLCTCYGFGIVRGVDMEREEVFISTPLPVSTMRHVNCLMGCIEVPVGLLQLNQQKNVPYTGGNDILPMGREHRRGYFRMRYKKVQRSA